MATDTSLTAVYADFAGKLLKFQLGIGEMGELERRCNAGIGEICIRLSAHRFYRDDIRETIRLGLIGGGEDTAGAEALLRYNVDRRPLAENLGLAARIVEACVAGVPPPGKADGPTSEASADPEISAASTAPAA